MPKLITARSPLASSPDSWVRRRPGSLPLQTMWLTPGPAAMRDSCASPVMTRNTRHIPHATDGLLARCKFR